MFKKAYVRGVTKALIDVGAVKFADDAQAIQAADALAAQLPEQPLEAVPPAATAELAANLIDLADSLQASADSASAAADAAAGGAAPESKAEPKSEPKSETKSAAIKNAAVSLRHWLSKRAVDTGATIVGTRPEQENRPENATTSEVKLDMINRPGGDAYANVGEDGVGGQQASGVGAIASEKKVEGPGAGPAEAGSNSTTEAVKGASLRAFIRKVAQGATIDGAQSFPNAPTGELQMDQAARPMGYAVQGEDAVGTSAMAAPIAAAAVGTEQPHPDQPAHEGGTNTVVEQTKGAQDEYLRRFKLTGQKYASALPFYLTETEKVAAIQYLMGIPPTEQARVLQHIRKTAEMPPALQAYVEAKKSEGEGEGEGEKEESAEEEKEEKEEKEETKEEGKEEKAAAVKEKRASQQRTNLLDRLRRIQAR